MPILAMGYRLVGALLAPEWIAILYQYPATIVRIPIFYEVSPFTLYIARETAQTVTFPLVIEQPYWSSERVCIELRGGAQALNDADLPLAFRPENVAACLKHHQVRCSTCGAASQPFSNVVCPHLIWCWRCQHWQGEPHRRIPFCRHMTPPSAVDI